MERIDESIEFLLSGSIPYEFRTTVVKELHNEEDFVRIGQWLKGARGYYLQAYKDSEEVLQPGFSSYSLEELEQQVTETIHAEEEKSLNSIRKSLNGVKGLAVFAIIDCVLLVVILLHMLGVF